MAISDTLAVTVSNKAFPLIERACETVDFLDKAVSRASFPFPEAPLVKSLLQQLAETLVETNEALAACQSQSRGRIRELVSIADELATLLEGVTQDERDRIETTAGMLQSEWFRQRENALERAHDRLWPDGQPNPHLREPFPARSADDLFAEALAKISGWPYPRNKIEAHFFNDPDHTEFCIECGQTIDTVSHRMAIEQMEGKK